MQSNNMVSTSEALSLVLTPCVVVRLLCVQQTLPILSGIAFAASTGKIVVLPDLVGPVSRSSAVSCEDADLFDPAPSGDLGVVFPVARLPAVGESAPTAEDAWVSVFSARTEADGLGDVWPSH